jgi:tRNA dimethylallyltransferase
VDVCDPRRDYSLADYVRDAEEAIGAIAARGHVPVVVGGTGMYLRGLLKGIVPLPPRDEALRDRLRALAARHGSERLWRLLSSRDPESARRIPPGDRQRVVRALELVFTAEGTWSDRLASEGTWAGQPERYPAMKFGLTVERDVHAKYLAGRVDAFFAEGLVDEVRALLASGVPASANAFKAIGYREVLAALSSGHDPEEAREAIVTATRRYAKRQRTWFAREPGVTWLPASEGEERLVARIVSAWEEAC